MSLNQKYTWGDFLRENPDFKGKRIKRTSPEGKKAFEAAYKAKIKDILKDRLAWIAKDEARATGQRDKLVADMKEAKRVSRRRKVQLKIGAKDKHISRLGRMTERARQVQKDI